MKWNISLQPYRNSLAVSLSYYNTHNSMHSIIPFHINSTPDICRAFALNKVCHKTSIQNPVYYCFSLVVKLNFNYSFQKKPLLLFVVIFTVNVKWREKWTKSDTEKKDRRWDRERNRQTDRQAEPFVHWNCSSNNNSKRETVYKIRV
jgi:hypothetical protein